MKKSVCLVLALSAFAQFHAEALEWDFDWAKMETGKAPHTVKFSSDSVMGAPQRLQVSDKNRLIVEEVVELNGPGLRIKKEDGAESYRPVFTLGGQPDLIAKGKVRIEWQGVILAHEAGPKYKGFEGLCNLVVAGNGGEHLFVFYAMEQGRKGEGIFASNMWLGRIEKAVWKMGKPFNVVIELDLDKKNYSIEYDGVRIFNEEPWSKAASIRSIQIQDATAHAAYGGTFQAAVGRFKVTAQ